MSAILRDTPESDMYRLEWEERQQLAEELAARGVCLEDAREWFEVGMVECTEEAPREPRARRGTKGWKPPSSHFRFESVQPF
tara:strand:+ start:298 stop:543 length:246 start_codon:yes stop_codon:yes gene_type:complete